ncbi:PucR family transcriptional regulator [Gordonia soli]|uniref:Putative CdaR family transcriptional regulator n=1 Tax=Gordonia soli NBRC 108243 TaxID=1223545 RepID=M0QI71_9ACTN|nr:PucR family transcriptional regulator ligand-binding domain-containing protein [Gordonia soli]GAC67991.1 putative CdaR family transcriptional regulator [Gordonia soli NBRC 108243]
MTTVRWLLAQRRLQLTLRGGAEGLDRTLDCAVSSELVNAHEWLSGGEVLLTTGLRLPASPSERIAYLARLHGVGVAAVGFGVGFGFDEVPVELVEEADRLALPIVEVPVPVPFSAIARAVLEQISAARSTRLVAATRAQPRMTRAAAAGGSAAVVRELADSVGRSAVLLDGGLNVVAAAPRDLGEADLEQIRALVRRDPASAGAAWVTGTSALTVTRVAAGGATFGHLGIIGREALDDVARMLVGHATSLLSIEHAKPQAVHRDTADLHSDALAVALDDRLSGDWAHAPTLARLISRGADPAGRVRVAVFGFADDESAQRGSRRLVDALEHRWRAVFVHRNGSDVVAMLRGDDTIEFVTGLLTMLTAHHSAAGGVGPVVDLADVAQSMRQARLACRSATVGQLVDLEGSRSLLSIESVRRALSDAYPQRLAPVLDHDRATGSRLRDTLLVYLEANGNWGEAATAAGVHRHTMRHRIERIEDMLQIDLTDARTRAELLLLLLGVAS